MLNLKLLPWRKEAQAYIKVKIISGIKVNNDNSRIFRAGFDVKVLKSIFSKMGSFERFIYFKN